MASSIAAAAIAIRAGGWRVINSAAFRRHPMQITINGEPRCFDAPLSLAELIVRLDLGGKRVAVERNGEIVPRSRHAETPLAESDRLEIVVAVGGG